MWPLARSIHVCNPNARPIRASQSAPHISRKGFSSEATLLISGIILLLGFVGDSPKRPEG